MWNMPDRSSRSSWVSLVILLALICTAGCSLNQRGMVLLVEPGRQAAVVASPKDGLSMPDGLLWRQGRLYVADEGGSAIRLWSGQALPSTVSDSKVGIKSPEDLVLDDGGNIYFTDDDAGGLWWVNNFGETRELAGADQGLTSTEGIALTPTGDILVGEGQSHKIFRVTPTGQVAEFLGADAAIRKAETMAFDDAGNLFIGDNEEDVLYLVTPNKELHRLIEHRDDFSPESIWYSHGTLYITDSKHGKLFTYNTRDGLDVVAAFGGELHAINGVTTDDRGSIYVSIQTDLKKKLGYIVKIAKAGD
jgi:sugar lactone lactonase YvrE